MGETEQDEFLICMENILKAIKKPNGSNEETPRIMLRQGPLKISDCFPEIEITLPNGKIVFFYIKIENQNNDDVPIEIEI